MKKFGKFLFTTVSVAACIGGAYYFIKNILNKNTVDDFNDFEDDFDDFDLSEESVPNTDSDDRGYVTLNFSEEDDAAENKASTTEKGFAAEDEPVVEEAPTTEEAPAASDDDGK